MNLPNKLTIARVCLIPVFLVLMQGGIIEAPLSRYLALGVFALASLTDFLDGYIARKQKLITDFGKLMDPLADKLLTMSALIAFVELGSIPAWVVITIISREFLVTGVRLVALSGSRDMVIPASSIAKLKTVSQMVLIIYMLCGFEGEAAGYISLALIAAALILTVVSGVDYVIKHSFVFKDM